MPSEAETDFSTGVYRCNDISSLKIRVCLKTVKSSSVPLSGLQEDVPDDKLEDQVFSWQQRVFSPWEIKFYSKSENCITELHKEYHKQVLQIVDDEKLMKNNIFSYTSQDVASGERKEILDIGYKSDTYLSRAMNQLSFSGQTEIHSQGIPKHNIVDMNPSLRTISQNHLLSSALEFMYIMADVGYLIEGECNEQVLVVMKWEPSLQVFTIFPDFNSSVTGTGYSLESLSDACYQYFFWVICSMPDGDVTQHKMGLTKDESKTQLSEQVALPRHGLLDIHLFGEIKSAQHFDSKNIFVNYYIELPTGWSSSSPDDLFGVTQSSKNEDRFSTFNHLFELNLTLNISSSEEYCHINTDLFPQLLLEVISMDNWGRVCREGYGWVRLPPIPGQYCFKINTWRPNTSELRLNLLRRYFVGATSHLADRTYFGVPKSFQGSNLSKYGFRSVASGNLHVDINVVLQSQHPSRFPSRMFLLERLSTATLVQSINNALKAFSSARQRMLKASLPISSD